MSEHVWGLGPIAAESVEWTRSMLPKLESREDLHPTETQRKKEGLAVASTDPKRGEIPPALTPDEWAARRSQVDEHIYVDSSDDDFWIGCVNNRVPIDGYGVEQAQLPKVMALANAALPDDDPRKITRDDAVRLQALLGAFAPDDSVRDWLPDLAAKLAALLPPADTRKGAPA